MNHIALEYYIFESNALIKKGKFKQFINRSDKLLTSPYLQNELQGVQLQIQLCRRLLFCRLKVIKRHFYKYTQKQSKIITSLCESMQLCTNMSILFNKCLDLGMKENGQRKKRKDLYFAYDKPTLKQYYQLVSKEQPDLKTLVWLRNQEKELFASIQEILIYSYLYFKYSQVKESLRFLQKAYYLKPISTYKSQRLYLMTLSYINAGLFEIDYSLNMDQLLILGMNMLEVLLKQYYQPWHDTKIVKIKMAQVSCIIILNLFMLTIREELSNQYHNCVETIVMAHFLSKNILEFLRVREELTSFINNEYEILNEKFEQVIKEEQDLNQLVGFIYTKGTKIGSPIKNKLLKQDSNHQTYLGLTSSKHLNISCKGQFICKTERTRPCTPVSSPISGLLLKGCYDMNNSSHFNSTTLVPTKDNTHILNITRDVTPTPRQQLQHSQQHSHSNSMTKSKRKKKQKLTQQQIQRSYLSQLINLRQICDFDSEQKLQESELQKRIKQLTEKLDQFDKPEQVQQVDRFFNKKINQITFEKCMTLDQVKEMANKIINAEWEVHKEMPTTKSLMKLVSLSDLQLEVQQQFSKFREYGEIEKQDFHNYQKEQAEHLMKENKDLKKLQLNQQKYQLNRKSEPQLVIDTQDAGISQKFVKRKTTVLVNSYANMMQGQRKLDINERKQREFKLTKHQLTDLMVKNLEDRDELIVQDQILKQQALPRQYGARKVYSPRGKEVRHSRNSSEQMVRLPSSHFQVQQQFFL